MFIHRALFRAQHVKNLLQLDNRYMHTTVWERVGISGMHDSPYEDPLLRYEVRTWSDFLYACVGDAL
jgi:hypothetical protein